jgi:CspA family cold shock protein
MQTTKTNGKVKWFNDAKGFGFVNEEGKSEDIFVHYSAIVSEGFKTLREDDEVTFELFTGPKGSQALNVIRTKIAEPKEQDEENYDE